MQQPLTNIHAQHHHIQASLFRGQSSFLSNHLSPQCQGPSFPEQIALSLHTFKHSRKGEKEKKNQPKKE
jgi:hypothetical protein